MDVVGLYRYPVKSMLGQPMERLAIGTAGVEGDRCLALVDARTGYVATAKHPRLWRHLLQFRATVEADRTRIRTPSGEVLIAGEPDVDDALSRALGREVRLHDRRTPGAVVERPDPGEVLDQGVEAEVPAPTLEIAQGAPGRTFVDYAPVHLITTATLDRLGVELLRYRPNLVIRTPPDVEAFVENDWTDREVHLTGEDPAAGPVVLRVVLPTPRCSVPTLAHGALGRSPEAVRALMTANRVDVPGFGVLPCAGAYAEVRRPGRVRVGDTAGVT